jgi:hypothetical protein
MRRSLRGPVVYKILTGIGYRDKPFDIYLMINIYEDIARYVFHTNKVFPVVCVDSGNTASFSKRHVPMLENWHIH